LQPPPHPTPQPAANVVAPANAFVALAPGRFTFAGGALLTSLLGLLIKPWRLIESTSSFFGWLVGYSVVLGPIAGILAADYHLLRGRQVGGSGGGGGGGGVLRVLLWCDY